MQNPKKSARQDHSGSTHGFNTSSSKQVQNYSKILQSLVSNSNIPHHKRTNSDYVNPLAKPSDKSIMDRSSQIYSIQQNSTSRFFFLSIYLKSTGAPFLPQDKIIRP